MRIRNKKIIILSNQESFFSFNTLQLISILNFSENASRWCWENGTWDNHSNYSQCRDVRLPAVESEVEITTMIYIVGYSLSLISLIVAVSIFLYYK